MTPARSTLPENRQGRRPATGRYALCLLALAGAALSASADNPYWQQYANQPVYVDQVNNGNRQTLKFTGYENNMLQAEISMKNPDGSTSTAEISLPVSENMARTMKFSLKNLKKANSLIDQGNNEGALTLLRPDVYPLVKYNNLPEIFTDLHIPIRTLLDTLVDAGEYGEAEDLVKRVRLGQVGVRYSNSAIRLMNAYLLSSDAEAASRIARMLPFSEGYASNIQPAIEAADNIRGAGLYEEVIPVYRAIQPHAAPGQRKDIDMWLAYSLVLADRMEEATAIIETVEEPDPSQRLFSLYKLLEGSRAYRQEDYSTALDILTRGFVRAETSYSWVPEMLYRIGDCYARAEDPVAARNVWSEITLLYPDSIWHGPASEAIDALPRPETLAE